jgi:hypothetical protein
LDQKSCYFRFQLTIRSSSKIHFQRAHNYAITAKRETWIQAYSLIDLAEVELCRLNQNRCQDYIARAKALSNYDFEKQAHLRITKMQTQIQKKLA